LESLEFEELSLSGNQPEQEKEKEKEIFLKKRGGVF